MNITCYKLVNIASNSTISAHDDTWNCRCDYKIWL